MFQNNQCLLWKNHKYTVKNIVDIKLSLLLKMESLISHIPGHIFIIKDIPTPKCRTDGAWDTSRKPRDAQRTDIPGMYGQAALSLCGFAFANPCHAALSLRSGRTTRGHAGRGSARPSRKLLPSVATSHVPVRYTQSALGNENIYRCQNILNEGILWE